MEDVEGWEVLPDDGFLQIHDDGGKKIYSRKYGAGSCNIFKNYFICPPSDSAEFVETTKEKAEQSGSRVAPKRLVPVTLIQVEPPDDDDQEANFKKIAEVPIEKTRNPSALLLGKSTKEAEEGDQDQVAQVCFKKMKETEFVDMKLLESPTRGMKPPPFPVDAAAGFQFVEGKGDAFDMKISSPRSLMKGEEEKIVHGIWEEAAAREGGFNLWKWSLTGVGAICSFGVAAATVCIIFFGAHHRNAKQHHQENHKLQFHIYTDDKRLKEQQVHPATKGNGAASALSRGRAHITLGGCYEEVV